VHAGAQEVGGEHLIEGPHAARGARDRVRVHLAERVVTELKKKVKVKKK
jgi:hypothetical protein